MKNAKHIEEIYEAAWKEIAIFKDQRRLRRDDPTEDFSRLQPTTSHQPQQDLSDQPFISVLWAVWQPNDPSHPYRIKTYLIKHR